MSETKNLKWYENEIKRFSDKIDEIDEMRIEAEQAKKEACRIELGYKNLVVVVDEGYISLTRGDDSMEDFLIDYADIEPLAETLFQLIRGMSDKDLQNKF